MPSYRVSIRIDALAAGVEPGAILPAAVGRARQTTVVENDSVEIVRGEPLIRLRFVAEHAGEALRIARDVLAEVEGLAVAGGLEVVERCGNRWAGLDVPTPDGWARRSDARHSDARRPDIEPLR